jgi:hypothetical protein
MDRADHYARSLILGQTMSGRTMLTSGRGGQAFGTVEAQLKQDRLQAAADFVADIFNEQIIPSIIRINYGDEEELPVCRFLQQNEGTYQDAQRDQILVNMGVPIPVSHIRKKYSIPEPEGDEEILAPPVRTPESSTAAGQPITLPEKASQGQPVTEQQEERAAKQQAEQAAGPPKPEKMSEAQKQLQAALERLSLIKDDALFAREFRRLTSSLVTADQESGNWITEEGRHIFISGERSARAKASHRGMTKGKMRVAMSNEARVAKAIGGRHLPDNEPFDIVKGNHGVEVKTIMEGKNDKITMHPESLQRKLDHAAANGLTPHTVAIDVRGGAPMVYYKSGVGSYRLGGMTPTTFAGLNNHIK